MSFFQMPNPIAARRLFIGHRVGPRHCGLLGRRAGSAMTCEGVADPKDRSDLIAYLKRMNETPECGK